MRAVTVVVLFASILAAVGVLLFLPEARWLSVVFFAAAAFVGYLLVSKRGKVEEAKRTHPAERENRMR